MNKLVEPVSSDSAFMPMDESLVDNPMYQSKENVLPEVATYDEINTGGFVRHVRRGGQVTTMNIIYGSIPRDSSRATTVQLEDMYRLYSHKDHREGFGCSCYHVVCLTSSLTVVISSKYVDVS